MESWWFECGRAPTILKALTAGREKYVPSCAKTDWAAILERVPLNAGSGMVWKLRRPLRGSTAVSEFGGRP